jgi:hypothetical protein
VPDLDAIAKITLLSKTGSEYACVRFQSTFFLFILSSADVLLFFFFQVQATLSNGRTARHAAVSWVVAAIFIAAFALALFHAFVPLEPLSGPGPISLLFIIVEYFQHVASCGALSLSYPGVFQAFASNFAWSLGAVDIPSVQSSINATVERTLGHTFITPSSTEQNFISPYGIIAERNEYFHRKRDTSSLGLPAVTVPNAPALISRDQLPVTVPGIAILFNRIDIPYPGAFLT